MDTPQLITALSRPEAYGFAVERIEVRQTHVSVLFFAGELVYKVKKPVDLGFLDFTTLEKRHHFCQEEIRLNRRLAPDMYLGIVPVVREPDGSARIAAAGETPGEQEIIDYAVEMRRLPEERMMDRLLDQGAVDDTVVDEIVDVILEFHRAGATGPGVDEHGTPDAVARGTLVNLEETEPFVEGPDREGTLSETLYRYLWGSAGAFVARNRDLLDQRVREGRIRDGHGDLHAANICLTDDGIVIYDCIEFDPGIRCADVAKDLAFLIMDLEARGLRDLGNHVVERYVRAAADPDLDTLLPLYKAHLACVRGKVNSIAAGDRSIDAADRSRARLEAMRYFHLAAPYWLPPALIVMCGLPGSGKSSAARHLERPLGAAVLCGDVIRKRLAGIPATAHPSGPEAEALYSRRSSQETFGTMLGEARTLLVEGRAVIADATFPHRGSRAPFVELARSLGAPYVVVYLDCPEPVIAERMRKRPEAQDEVSDADWEVYQQFKGHFEPPDEIPPGNLVTTDSTGDPETMTAQLIDRLIGQLPRLP
jgi:aminoglycoside phosphotransferase family enzyme/predicted kinase